MENFQRKWTSKTGNVIVKNKSNTIFLFPMIHTPIDVKMFKTLKWNHEPQESGSTWVLTSSLRSIRVQTMENCCRCLMEHESACYTILNLHLTPLIIKPGRPHQTTLTRNPQTTKYLFEVYSKQNQLHDFTGYYSHKQFTAKFRSFLTLVEKH